MKFSAPVVVAFWALINAVLATTLGAFGEQPVVITLYAAATALVAVIALVVWAGRRREKRRSRWPQAPNGDSVVIFAAGLIIAGLGWAFYAPLALVATLPRAIGVIREISARHGGLWND